MSAIHQSPQYTAMQRKLRPRYQAEIEQGTAICGRCGRRVTPTQKFHAGHIMDAAVALAAGWPEQAINAEDNFRLEHARCNTQAGGRLSQAMTAKTKTGTDTRHWQW